MKWFNMQKNEDLMNRTWLFYKTNLKLCLKDYIFQGYYFLAEVTFDFFTKDNQYSALSHKVVKSTKGKARKMKSI